MPAAEILRKLRLCIYLARLEFDRRFAGSVGGRLWVFASPLLTIGVIWIALDYGLGMRSASGPAFGISLAVGLAVWLFFAEALNSSLNSILGQPHLVKKIVFPVILLPLAQAIVAYGVHLIVLLAVVAVLLLHQSLPWPELLALPFWSGCLFVFAASCSMLAAAVNVHIRDAAAILPNAVSLVFWLTPIIWPLERVPSEWRSIALLNPMAVVVEGHRNSLLGSPAPLSLVGSILFAVALAVFALLSVRLFRFMRLLFADVM
jgi:teichoic acid transport system permease protein